MRCHRCRPWPWNSGRKRCPGQRTMGPWGHGGLFKIAMDNGPFIDDFPIKTTIYEGFSMAMLNNQMVFFSIEGMKYQKKIQQNECVWFFMIKNMGVLWMYQDLMKRAYMVQIKQSTWLWPNDEWFSVLNVINHSCSELRSFWPPPLSCPFVHSHPVRS